MRLFILALVCLSLFFSVTAAPSESFDTFSASHLRASILKALFSRQSSAEGEGLTLDICSEKSDCKSPRLCGRPSTGASFCQEGADDCVCQPPSIIMCNDSDDCEAGEGCVKIITLERICISREASKRLGYPLIPGAADPTPAPSPSRFPTTKKCRGGNPYDTCGEKISCDDGLNCVDRTLKGLCDDGKTCYCKPPLRISCKDADCKCGQVCIRSQFNSLICVSRDVAILAKVPIVKDAQPLPSPSVSPTTSRTPTNTPTRSPTPSSTPSAEPSASRTSTPKPKPSKSSTPAPSKSRTPTPSPVSASPTPSSTKSQTPTPSPISASPTPSSKSQTPTPSSISQSPSISVSPSPKRSRAPMETPTATDTPEPSEPVSVSADPGETGKPEPTDGSPSKSSGPGSSGTQSTPSGVAAAATPSSSNTSTPTPAVDICIGAHHLLSFSSKALLYPRHRLASVLCDQQSSCATPGHIVVYRHVAMRMSSYCGLVRCKRRVMRVNSPRWSKQLTISSGTEGLLFTAFAARYDTRAEEVMLRALVRAGL